MEKKIDLLKFAREKAELYYKLEEDPSKWGRVLNPNETCSDWLTEELFTVIKKIEDYFSQEGY